MLQKPLCPLKHHRAPIQGVDETNGLVARCSLPVESNRPSVSLGPWSVEDVQTSLSTSIQRICEAAGLEAAVTSWWRGPRCSAGKAGRKEDTWLRSAVLSGATTEKVRQKLARSGIPEAVIDGGLQLGHFIAEDPGLLQAYQARMKEASEREAGETTSFIFARIQQRSDPRLEFIGHVVSQISRRYDLIYRASMQSEESTCIQPASLTLAPKPPRRPSNQTGRRRPKPILEPSCSFKHESTQEEDCTASWEPEQSDAPKILAPTRPTTLSPVPISEISSISDAVASDLEVTAVTASSHLAKTLKLSDDIADARSSTATPHLGRRASFDSIYESATVDDRSSTATPHLGSRASFSSMQWSASPDERSSTATPRQAWRASTPSGQGPAIADERSSTTPSPGNQASVPSIPLEAPTSQLRDSWLSPVTPTRRPSTSSSSLPISARNPQLVKIGKAKTHDLSNAADLMESPRSKGPQLSQTAPEKLSLPLATLQTRSSLIAVRMTGRSSRRRRTDASPPRSSSRKRKMATSSFERWHTNTPKQSDEKQTDERQESKKEKENTADDAKGLRPWNLLASKKGCRKVIQDLGELKTVFDSFDKDGSGAIEQEEFLPFLAKVMKQPAGTLNRQEIWRHWDEMDEDGSGSIPFEEFRRWYCNTFDIDNNPDRTAFISEADVDHTQKMIRNLATRTNVDILKLDQLHAEFKKLDEDASGMLEFAEFKDLIQRELSAGGQHEIPTKVVSRFWMDIDADGSGEVNFDEFVTWYMKFFYGSKSPMEQYYEVLGGRNPGF